MCISSIQQSNENSIKFSLSTQTRSGSKLSQSKGHTLELDFTSRVPSALDLAHLNSHNLFNPQPVVITITTHLYI